MSTSASAKAIAPYGSWESPITAQMLVTGAAGINEVVPDGDRIWWAESRPDEGGRVAVMCHQEDHSREVTPVDTNVRTTMHEYGGGAWWASKGTLWYVDYQDQRLRQIDQHDNVTILSANASQPKGLRYADIRPTPDHSWLICVCESHTSTQSEPVNQLVAISTSGSQQQVLLAQGADFYGSPCLSSDGRQLAWIEWDHPNMPWDTTRLMLAELQCSQTSIATSNTHCIAGGEDEAIVQPLWSPGNQLHYLSDKNDLWQLYAQGQTEPVLTVEGEIGYPPWVHGLARYGFDANGNVTAAYFNRGIDHLPGYEQFTAFHSVRLSGSKLAVVAASWQQESTVFYDNQVIRAPRDTGISDEFLPAPEILSFPTGSMRQSNGMQSDDSQPQDNHQDIAHALFFRPANPDFTGPENDKPPLIVLAHGGPTSAARSQLSLAQRFWTSRGFAVVDVNYRGSSGYGRTYRQKLNGQWGIADVEDCVAVAQYLSARGDVDPERLIIRGGSAGGFTVLSALALHDTFTAGASMYGVADLEALANDTHKFESRYLDSLIGRWPEDAEIYASRSPINHLDGFTAPMIVLQGSEDAIVPPNQSRMIVEALDKKGVPVAYLEFEGEQHGFRQASTITRAILSELCFYGRVFGFEPADELMQLTIRNSLD